jgi:hypothetical protein
MRELASKATPGPTEVGVIPKKSLGDQVRWYEESLTYGLIDSNSLIDVYGVYIKGTDTPICHTGNGPTSQANAAFIAACTPERILAYEDCVAALREYARHSEGCSAVFGDQYRCRCGFSDIAALAAQEKP